MNNYSLGGFDPSLVEQIYNYVQPSPFATSAMRDPSLVGQTSEMLTRLSYPNDKLAPPTYSDVSMPSGQPEHDALDVIGAIFKAPFRLIGAAKNGLEEAIGHPNADKRAMQDDYLQMMERLALTSGALTQQQKAMLFPQWYEQDRTAMASAQTGGDATAKGRDTSGMPLPTPRKPGVLEWIMGDAQKENARRLATIKAMEGAVAMNMEAEKLRTQKGTTYKEYATGYNQEQQGRKESNLADEVAPNARAWRTNELASANEHNAGANEHNAKADATKEWTRTVLPSNASAAAAEASLGWGKADNQWRYGPLLSEAEIRAKNSEAWKNNAQGYDYAEQGMTRGRVADANVYESTAKGDAAILGTQDDQARARSIGDLDPIRKRLLESQIGVNEGQTRNLDARTSVVAALANAKIDQIQAQTQGLIGGQALTEAKMRLMEIQGGVMQTREQRDAAMSDVKRLLLQTRAEIAERAQTNADEMTVARLKQIDADIERLGSVVDLNNARAGDVGSGSGPGGGGTGLSRFLLAQAGRENAHDTKTLLTIMNDDFGDVYRTANGLDMLGKVRGKDYVINEPGWIASKFGNKKPSIEFPEGSSLRGVLDQYRNEAPARRFLANEGPVAATDPAAIPGQGPGQVSGETLTLLMDHGYGKLSPDDVAKSIDRAYQDEQISEGQARSAFEFLGAQRKR